MSAFRTEFVSVGMHVPPRVVKNDDLKTLMDTSDEWIRQRTGIEERRWVEGANSNSDLALEATQEALDRAKLKKEEIDLIVFATLSPDYEFPGTGCFLQSKLGIPGTPTIDIRQACSGFIYGTAIADQFIRAGTYQNILMVGSEVHSKGLDKTPNGRDVGVLFGDGAGVAVLSRTEVKDVKTDSHILSTHLHTDGKFAKELWIQSPSCAGEGDRLTEDDVKAGRHFPKMNGKVVFVHATKRMAEVIGEGLEANGLQPDDIDLFVFHQANLRINDTVGKQLKVPGEKVFNTIQKYGNTTAATIPIGLYEAEAAGKLKKGMLVASAAFGSGFTWASMILRW